MELTRRGFLGALAVAAAGLALDPERALWVPGQKRIFLPAPPPSLFSATELYAGDVFTVDGLFARNPLTYVNTGQPIYFIATSNMRAGVIDRSLVCPNAHFVGPYANVAGVLTPNARIRPVMYGPSPVVWGQA